MEHFGDNYPFFDKEHYTPEELAKEAIKFDNYNSVLKAIKKYGLERTEDVIKECYKTMPTLRKTLLEILYKVWKGL